MKISSLYNILIVVLVLLPLLQSCNRGDEIKNGLIIGSKEKVWRSVADSLIRINVLENDSDDYGIAYIAYIPLNDTLNFRCNLEVNDKYKFGILRKLEFQLGDTLSYTKSGKPYNSDYFGDRDKQGIELLYEKLLSTYGSPDSSVVKPYYQRFDLEENGDTVFESNKITWVLPGETAKPKIYSDSMCLNPDYPNIYSKWEKEGFDIIFSAKAIYPKYAKEWSKEYSSDSYLKYIINEYEYLYKLICDSVKRHQKPRDLITLDCGKVVWKKIHEGAYDYELKFFYSNVSRPWSQESKEITNVRVDFILTDNFGKELCRFEGIDITLSSALSNGTTFLDVGGEVERWASLKYDDQNPDSKYFEKARLYSQNFEVKCRVEVNGVKFLDNTVLNN
jgi:hypothetical protein